MSAEGGPPRWWPGAAMAAPSPTWPAQSTETARGLALACRPGRNGPEADPWAVRRPPKPLEAPKTRNGGGDPRSGPIPGDPAENGAHRATERRKPDPPKGRGTPDFAALAEAIEARLTLGKRARAWIEARHLDPERLEGAGWRSSTGIEGRALLAEHGAALPQLIRRAESLLWLPVWDADGRPASYRARPLDIGGVGTRTLPGDKGRIYGAEAWCAPPGEVLHVAEGETDREALIEAGALWAVGLPGAGALHGAVVDLARAVEPSRVCPWFDGDRPGKWAAAALAGKLTAAGIAVRRWHFPPGMDCGDAWRQNPTALAAKVREMEDPNPRSEAA